MELKDVSNHFEKLLKDIPVERFYENPSLDGLSHLVECTGIEPSLEDAEIWIKDNGNGHFGRHLSYMEQMENSQGLPENVLQSDLIKSLNVISIVCLQKKIIISTYYKSKTLSFKKMTSEERFNILFKYLDNNKSFVPECWAKILLDELSKQDTLIKGTLKYPDKYNTPFYTISNQKFLQFDQISFLALKTALENEEPHNIHNNRILLKLSGGVAAFIKFINVGNTSVTGLYRNNLMHSNANKTINLSQTSFFSVPSGYVFKLSDITVYVDFVRALMLRGL